MDDEYSYDKVMERNYDKLTEKEKFISINELEDEVIE